MPNPNYNVLLKVQNTTPFGLSILAPNNPQVATLTAEGTVILPVEFIANQSTFTISSTSSAIGNFFNVQVSTDSSGTISAKVACPTNTGHNICTLANSGLAYYEGFSQVTSDEFNLEVSVAQGSPGLFPMVTLSFTLGS